MAIAFDANLGANDYGTGGTTQTLTTTAAAAAAARVVVLISYWQNGTSAISGVTVAGTACAQDKKAQNGNDYFEIWSCHRSGTTAISSSIVVTWNNTTSVGGILVGAGSFTGILTSAAVDATSNSNSTAASWASGSATNITTEALFIGGSGVEDITNPTTSAAVNGTEIHDRYRVGDQQGFVTGYRIEATVASRNVSGTLSNANSTANTGALVIYGSATGGGGGTVVKQLAALGVG